MKLTLEKTRAFVDATDPNLTETSVQSTIEALIACEESQRSSFVSVNVALNANLAFPEAGLRREGWGFSSGQHPVKLSNWLVRSHQDEHCGYLFVLAGLVPRLEHIQELWRVVEESSGLGLVSARIGRFGGGLVYKLDGALGDPDIDLVPESVVRSAPDYYDAHGRVGTCFLARSNLLRDFGPLDEQFENVDVAFRDLLLGPAREAFRGGFANHAVVDSATDFQLGMIRDETPRDRTQLETRSPLLRMEDSAWAKLSAHAYEGMLSRASSFSAALRKTLVIDLRCISAESGPLHDLVLSALDGIALAGEEWRVRIQSTPRQISHLGLMERFPGFECVAEFDSQRFTVAFSPIPPASTEELAFLHDSALLNFFMIPAGYQWDGGSEPTGSGLQLHEPVLRMADGLVFSGEFQREEFRRRYPHLEHIQDCVARTSLNPSDYTERPAQSRERPFVLLVDHSGSYGWMSSAVEDLTHAFPVCHFTAVGFRGAASENLEILSEKGSWSESTEHLPGEGDIVIFPCRWEGSGLLLLRSLAAGCTVLARRSATLRELAAHYRGPGKIVPFDGQLDLVRCLGAILHGDLVSPLSFGTSLGGGASPPSWRQFGQDLLRFFEERTTESADGNWTSRESLFRGIAADTVDFSSGSIRNGLASAPRQRVR